MIALSYMAAVGEMTSDPRTAEWIEELMTMDPHWYRPHELRARLFLRQQRLQDALREATIAHQLAPFVESSADLWRRLNAARRELGVQKSNL